MPDLTLHEEIARPLDLAARLESFSAGVGLADGSDFSDAAIALRALVERVREQDAEIARLREALEKIASETAATWVSDAARAALAQKEEPSS